MNETIFRYLNSFAGKYEWLDASIIFSGETLGIILLIGLVIFLFSHEHKEKGFHNIIVVFGAILFAWGVSWIIKHVYPSPRPFIALDDVTKLINYGGMDSFPSGHATFFAAMATVLYFYHKKIALFYALGAVFIGVSRVVAGIHWPLDILVGYLLGGVVASFTYILYSRLVNLR